MGATWVEMLVLIISALEAPSVCEHAVKKSDPSQLLPVSSAGRDGYTHGMACTSCISPIWSRATLLQLHNPDALNRQKGEHL